MKILVTGGSGFIGTNLVDDLLQHGHEVLIYDKQKSRHHPDSTLVADVRDADRLASSLEGIDVVYHLAAEHRDDVRPVSLYYDVNVGGARNLVDAAEKSGVRHIIFTSSVAVYGLNVGTPGEDSPLKPFNDYSQSKARSEEVFKEWAGAGNGRSLVIVRPVVIFGERNRGNVYRLLRQIASGGFLMVGNGGNRKSMGYVRNISRFLVQLLESETGVRVYNYADKPDMRVDELVRTARRAMGMKPRLNVRIPYPVGLLGGYAFDILSRITGRTYPISSIRIKKFAADTTVAAERLKETGFVAPYSLEEGLRRMIESEFGQGIRD